MDFFKKLFGSDETGVPPVKSLEDQPQDEKELIDYVKGKVTEIRGMGNRVSNEAIWMTNYAYTIGYNGVFYDTNSRAYRATSNAGGMLRRDRIHVNKILPTVQRRQARLCKNAPRFEVRPDDASQEARDRARLEQEIIERDYEGLRIQEKRLLMMTGLQNCGHYFMGPYWNEELGELLDVEEKEDGTKEFIYEGDLQVDLIHPLEMFFDPLATTIDDAQWCCRAKVRKLEYFRMKYPERGALVKEESGWLLSLQNETRLQNLNGQGSFQGNIQMQMQNSAIELCYYERRSKNFPNGRMIICANGVLLVSKELPVGEIPIVKFDDIPIAGKFYPEAIVTHLRPIQDQYNRLINARSAWTNRLLAGKLLAAKGSGIQQEALTDQSGEVVWYNAVPNCPVPTQLSIPVMPQYAYTEEDKLNDMFYDIAGEGEISRGILPAAGIPAIGMQLLLEQDETRVAAMTEQHEHAFARLMRLCLMYREKFVTNERLLKIADPNAQYVIKKYSGNDLKSKHDIVVIRGSLAPTSTAVKRNDILNLYDKGLIGDPADPQVRSKVLSYLEFGDRTSVWRDQALDGSQYKKHIEQIENEILPDVDEGDNHPYQWQELNRYRKSDKFDALTPVSQGMLKQTMEEHLKYMMKLTAPQFGMQPDAATQVEGDVQAEMDAQGLPVEEGVMDQQGENPNAALLPPEEGLPV